MGSSKRSSIIGPALALVSVATGSAIAESDTADKNKIAGAPVALRQSIGSGGSIELHAKTSLPVKAPIKQISEHGRTFYVTVYRDIFVDTNFYSLPFDAVTGQLDTHNVFFQSIGVGYTIIPSFSLPMPFCACSVNGLTLELEGQFGKYSGLQHTYESDLAVLVRSPQLPLFAGFSVNFAIGLGGSYAFSRPEYEGSFAAEGELAAGPQQFLIYLPMELEFTHDRLNRWHLVLNVHHRSGGWGAIAPEHSGANYVGGGIRVDF